MVVFARRSLAATRPRAAARELPGRAAVRVLALVLTGGCGGAPAPTAATAAPPSVRAGADANIAAVGNARRSPPSAKATLFRAAALVPTPEGERARQELAWADSIRQALARDPALVSPWVEVRATAAGATDTPRGWWEPPPAWAPAHVLVVAGVAADTAEADPARVELHGRIARVVTATVGPLAPAELTIELHPAPDPPRPRGATSLLFAVLGLGLSAGVVLERIRSRRRGPAGRGRPL